MTDEARQALLGILTDRKLSSLCIRGWMVDAAWYVRDDYERWSDERLLDEAQRFGVTVPAG